MTFTAWRFLSKKPDFGLLEISGSVEDLIQTLLDEINTALSLNETEIIHKFNPDEPPIDGEVAASIAFKVSETAPCIIMLHHEANGDVRIVLHRMMQEG